MSEPAAESTSQLWACGGCRRTYKAVPPQPSECTCETPVATMRPTWLTVMAATPSSPVRAANEQDQIRHQFARRGKQAVVTVAGAVVEAYTVNGADLTLIIETSDGRRIAVRPEAGDLLADTT